MSEQSDKLDARLVDLSRRERALADVEAKPATGPVQPFPKVLASLAAYPESTEGHRWTA